MEYQCYGWAHPWQQEGMEELRQCLAYSGELEAEVMAGKEQIARKELAISKLEEALARAVKERNEVEAHCQKLTQENFFLQQQLPEVQEHVSFSGDCSSEDDPKGVEAYTGKRSVSTEVCHRLSLDEDFLSHWAGDLTLPKKGKLLQAVKDAGPLLKSILLAGPLPQWQHPPPRVDCVEIPLVNILVRKRNGELRDAPDPEPASKFPKLTEVPTL